MASSLRTSFFESFPSARMISWLLLGSFLFFTYRIIRTEVEANSLYERSQPAAPSEESPLSPPEPQARIDSNNDTSRPSKATKQDKRTRKGSRREWYEKRKRRWFTPPAQEIDRGLPRTRSTFKVA